MPTKATGNVEVKQKATPTQMAKAFVRETPEARQAMEYANVDLEKASLKEIGLPLVEDPLAFNRFITNIYNKFAMTEVVKGRFHNPLDVLKKADVRLFGDTIERMIFNPAKAIDYFNTEDNILTPAKPDVKVEYVRINRHDKYPVSLPYEYVMNMFQSEAAFSEFLIGAMNTLYNGDARDEYRLMLKAVSDIYTSGYLNNVELSANNDDITVGLINTIDYFGIISTKYNTYSRVYPDSPLESWSNPENIVILTTIERINDIRVKFLSGLFNLSEAEIKARIIKVDEFENPDIEMAVMDLGYFQFRDQLRRVDSFHRADDLSTKTYYHVWQSINMSMFANAVVFRKNGSNPPAPPQGSTASTEVNIPMTERK